MEDLPRELRHWESAAGAGRTDVQVIPPLLAVLWRRRWTLLVTAFVCLMAAGVYLAFATRIYRASASLHVAQSGPKVFSDNQGFSAPSEGFLGTQASIVRSSAVLSRALNSIDPWSMLTLDGVSDPLRWLQGDNGLEVEAASRSDLLIISMESPYPDEAVEIVNSVVKGYIEEQIHRRRLAGSEIVKVLQAEREELQRRRDAAVRAMAKHQRDRGVLSFRTNDNGNTVLQRAASLSEALTAAEIATLDLRAQQQSLKEALKDPEAMLSYVESLQFRAGDSGDREYDELRAQLVQQSLALTTAASAQGDNHPNVRVHAARLDLLKKRIAAKQRGILDAQIIATSTRLAAAEEQERQLRSTLMSQHAQAVEMTPDALAVASLEADVAQMQKQCEVLDARIAEVSANSVEAGPLNIEVIDWARAGTNPVSPRKGLMLIAALVGSWVLAVGVALLRELRDTRFHSSDDVAAIVGTPVIAEVPCINRRLPSAVRGQVVHLDARSTAAQAYRSIRTSLSLGAGRDARSILVASPTPGDGKSTTASNLAITFANAGYRTLLIDCDLVRPVQHLIFDCEHEYGLTSVAAGEGKLRDAICATVVPRLHVLPCGPVPSNPSDLLTSKRFALLMQALLGAFDRIVIDSPPLSTVSDAHVLAASSEATLLVLRLNQSQRLASSQAVEGLRRVRAKLLGVVLNDVPAVRSFPRYSYTGLGSDTAFTSRQLVVRRRRVKPQQQQGSIPAIVEPDWAMEGSGSGNVTAGV